MDPECPVVSVLMPVHNAAGCVGRAIASVLSQTFAGLELLAIENGSTDGTRGVLAQWALRDPRIRLVCLPDADLVGALNHGLSLARGAFIARMDADDVCRPRRLQLQLCHLEQHRDTGVVSCLVSHAGDRAAQQGYAAYVEWVNSLRTHEQISINRFVESPIVHPSVLFRRDLAARLGAWRSGSFPEDYDLWLRWLECGVRMEKVPEVLLDWSDPPGRLSRTDARYSAQAFCDCKADYLARWLADAVGRRTLLFWGAGRETRRRLRTLRQLGVRPEGWIDINPRKWGMRIDGAVVHSPARMPPAEECFVVSCVSNRGARDLIARSLEARGFAAGRDYILAG
ncbi:MAG TPA: glycosyltransferase family 2 protein [Bryobacteraceae bacterium]|nr:glycosyltransferase family 2 protein [Bryobacteraceae bacterium]